MTEEDLAVFQQNIRLKKGFLKLGLDPAPVIEFLPYKLDIENHRLDQLLQFTIKYQECHDRKTMELLGMPWPPVFPGISPETDWVRFEKWLEGEDLTLSLYDKVLEQIEIIKPNLQDPQSVEVELKKIYGVLDKLGVGVDLVSNLPAAIEFQMLVQILKEDTDSFFEFGWSIDGCSGYCPGCLQRPWCSAGLENKWPEDIEAGKMSLTPELENFVSASPHSLQMLSNEEEDEDLEFEDDDLPYNRDDDAFYSPLDYPEAERPDLNTPANLN